MVVRILFLTLFLPGLSSFVAKAQDTIATAAPVAEQNLAIEATSVIEEEVFDDLEYDPLESLNRIIYSFNFVFDACITKPLAIAYRLGLPEEVRNGIGNAFTNLGAPVTFVNHLLQGQLSRAGTTLLRFGINTTLGIGGLFNPAEDLGFPGVETNFNETLAVWGVETGPYLMLPIIGPSSFRGALGIGADYYTQPLSYALHPRDNKLWIYLSIKGVEFIHYRNLVLEALDDLEATSLDTYASLKSIYFQKQAHRLTQLKRTDETPAMAEKD